MVMPNHLIRVCLTLKPLFPKEVSIYSILLAYCQEEGIDKFRGYLKPQSTRGMIDKHESVNECLSVIELHILGLPSKSSVSLFLSTSPEQEKVL